MNRATLFLLSLAALASGCTARTDYVIYFSSQDPFHPKDPNELLAELTSGLPVGVEIEHFLYTEKPDEMRGTVLVTGGRASHAVREAVRDNPRLAGGRVEKASKGRKSLICFESRPPFAPAGESDVLTELERGLPPCVKPAIARSRLTDDKIILWTLVKSDFGKEAAKFAIRRNPNLLLLQVEAPPPFPLLLLGPRTDDRRTTGNASAGADGGN